MSPVCGFNPLKSSQSRGDAHHALGQALPSPHLCPRSSPGGGSHVLAGVPEAERVSGVCESLAPSLPQPLPDLLPSPRSLHLLDKRAAYCHADVALLPISRLIVQLIRQLGDSCRDGFVERSVLPLIYVTCSNYHLHSSVQQ